MYLPFERLKVQTFSLLLKVRIRWGVFCWGDSFFRWKRNTSKSGYFFQEKIPVLWKYNILNRNNIKNAS